MNKYTVKNATEKESNAWDTFINENNNCIFHQFKWLKIVEKYTNSKLLPLMVYKEKQLTGLFPIFVKSYFGIKSVSSPPPKMGIPEMGPIISKPFATNYKNEKERLKILDSLILYLEKTVKPDFVYITTQNIDNDFRPFIWGKYKVQPFYSYYIGLNIPPEQIFKNFDGTIRTGIRKIIKNKNIKIQLNNDNDFYKIVKLVKDRYLTQGLKFPLDDNYLNDVFISYRNRIHVLGAEVNNQIINGIVLLEKTRNIISHWIGGVTTTAEYSGINELLHWKAINIFKEKFDHYELMGANTPHLIIHKTKYSPELVNNYSITKANIKGQIALRIYESLLCKK